MIRELILNLWVLVDDGRTFLGIFDLTMASSLGRFHVLYKGTPEISSKRCLWVIVYQNSGSLNGMRCPGNPFTRSL